MAAAQGSTYPAAGVTVANPATAPVSAPIMLGLVSRLHAMNNQAIIATEAAMSVLTNAIAAIPFAASALPPLNPNHPNQSRPVPRATKAILCGAVLSPGANFLLPTMKTDARES